MSDDDELKKKVLELRYTIDKKDSEIEKYQRALRVAGDDIGRIVKLSATPLRNRPHMVFCSQGTS